MFEVKKKYANVNGVAFETFSRDVEEDESGLTVEAGTTGLICGDGGDVHSRCLISIYNK